MAIGDLGIESLAVEPALLVTANETRWEQEVDAIGFVPDFFFDPLEFRAQPLGRMRSHAEDAHPAGLRYGGRDVTAMCEGKDRKFEFHVSRELGVHRISPVIKISRVTKRPALVSRPRNCVDIPVRPAYDAPTLCA